MTFIDFTLSNARRFYSSMGNPLAVKGLRSIYTHLSCSTNQELVEEAFLPTLQTLFSAPVSSPLASVNINNVAELLVELTNSKYLTKKTANSIDTTEVQFFNFYTISCEKNGRST